MGLNYFAEYVTVFINQMSLYEVYHHFLNSTRSDEREIYLNMHCIQNVYMLLLF